MGEEEAAFVKVQARKAGNYMVTIPAEVAEGLKLKESQRVKVLWDKQERRVIYQF
jgi:bifunctional DNA-binding transcriptional regulator/antitoxin component of YhaV-PrlF toxin-antitoxin module